MKVKQALVLYSLCEETALVHPSSSEVGGRDETDCWPRVSVTHSELPVRRRCLRWVATRPRLRLSRKTFRVCCCLLTFKTRCDLIERGCVCAVSTTFPSKAFTGARCNAPALEWAGWFQIVSHWMFSITRLERSQYKIPASNVSQQ